MTIEKKSILIIILSLSKFYNKIVNNLNYNTKFYTIFTFMPALFLFFIKKQTLVFLFIRFNIQFVSSQHFYTSFSFNLLKLN